MNKSAAFKLEFSFQTFRVWPFISAITSSLRMLSCLNFGRLLESQTLGRLRIKDIQSQLLSGNYNRPSQGNINFYNENCIKKESHQTADNR